MKEKLSSKPVALRRFGSEILLNDAELFRGGPDDLLDAIDHLVSAGDARLVVTPNVDQVIALSASASLREAYSSAALCLVDGAPIRLLASMMGVGDIQRHTGADLLPLVASVASGRGWRIGIAGGAEGVAQSAAHRLSAQYEASVFPIAFPQIRRVESKLTEQTFDRNSPVIRQMEDAGVNIIFLCLGSPKQEEWFMRHKEWLPPGVYIGAGAAVDFAAGHLSRAPRWVQQIGAEWLWRFFQEPKRLFTRYFLRGPRFLPIALRSLRAGKADGRRVREAC